MKLESEDRKSTMDPKLKYTWVITYYFIISIALIYYFVSEAKY